MESKTSGLRAVPDGKRTFTAETYMEFKPPMLAVIPSSILWEWKFGNFIVSADSVFCEITVKHSFQYLHLHGKKAQNDTGSRQSEEKEEKGDALEVFDGSGELVDAGTGVVHFHQQEFVFRGAVDMAGILAGAKVDGKAVITSQEPTLTTDEGTGLITGAAQNFTVAVTITAV